jgi:hypothetical protein
MRHEASRTETSCLKRKASSSNFYVCTDNLSEDIREMFDFSVGHTFQLLAEQQAQAQKNNLDIKV